MDALLNVFIIFLKFYNCAKKNEDVMGTLDELNDKNCNPLNSSVNNDVSSNSVSGASNDLRVCDLALKTVNDIEESAAEQNKPNPMQTGSGLFRHNDSNTQADDFEKHKKDKRECSSSDSVSKHPLCYVVSKYLYILEQDDKRRKANDIMNKESKNIKTLKKDDKNYFKRKEKE